jgi:hypothetical protein
VPHDPSKQKPLMVEAHAYTPDSEPEVLAILHGAFGPIWGDQAFWRWKHVQRPGFCELDVRVYRSAGTVVGCWHMAERRLRLDAGLEITASVEGDYAMQPEWRGVGMGRDPASLREVRLLAERGIVARFAFTSPVLFERIYRPKLGYRRIRTVTAQYRKLISDAAVRERLQRAGERLSSQGFTRKLVCQRPLSIAIEVRGFRRCLLVLDAQGARCTWEHEVHPDLAVGVPYAIINTRTVPAAARVASFALLGGKLRIRYATRFMRRILSALLS